MVVAEADLVLGQDHPPRRLPAKLALVERRVEDRQVRAGKRRRQPSHPASKFQAPQTIWRASPSPTSTWHTRSRSAFGCASDVEHPADEEAAEIAVEVGDADVDDPLDVERGDREPPRDLLRSRVDGDVVGRAR